MCTHRIFLLLLVLIVFRNDCLAQHRTDTDMAEDNFVSYGRQQGLSHNIITGLAQDSIGYIWVSTSAGLNRFNGSQFVQFHSTNDSASLPQDNLSGMEWLDRQKLAVRTNAGLHIIDTRNGNTRNLLIPNSNKLYQYRFNNVRSVTSNSAGDVFVLTYSGFYHFDRDYQLVFRYDHYRQEEAATTYFAFGRKLFWLDQQHLMIHSIDGMYYYDTDRKFFKKMEKGDYPLFDEYLDHPSTGFNMFQPTRGCLLLMNAFSDTLIYMNLTDKRRTVSRLPFHTNKDEFDYRTEMFAIDDTLICITGKLSGFFKMRVHPESGRVEINTKKYFPAYFCKRILKDKNGYFWIATNNGLFCQDNYRSFIKQATVPPSLQAQYSNLIMDDVYVSGDKLFAATRGSGGLLVFDKNNLRFIKRIGFEKEWNDPAGIYSISLIDKEDLLVGLSGPPVRLSSDLKKKTKIIPDNWITDSCWIAGLCRDRKNNIWIAAETVYKYDHETRRFIVIAKPGSALDKIVRAQHIVEDASGNIWLAGHGLMRYNVMSERFDRLVDSFPFVKIFDKQIVSIAADRENNLWFSGNNSGLIYYNINKRSFRHFTRENGLPDNDIVAIIVVGGKLWIGTFSGIACMDLKTFEIRSFGKDDGFPDEPISRGAGFFYDSVKHKIYIGFAKTVAQFDPDIVFQSSPVPHIFIEGITAGSRKKVALPGDRFTTSWRNNELTVSIGSINFLTSNSQRFAYRLLDNDGQWQELGLQNTFSISNLSPGHHLIQVKLFSLSNRWQEQVAEIDVNILPPFWKQNWFLIFAGILGVLIVFLLYKWRTGAIRKQERAKTHLQELKAEEYKNQFELEQISNYFSSHLIDKGEVDDVLWDVAKNLIGRMGYADCMIYLWNEDKTRMVQKASYGPKGDPQAITTTIFDVLPGQGVVGHVMLTKEPLLLSDTRRDPRYRVDDIARLSEICVPIIHNDELVGIIDSEHPEPNHFKERDIKILTTIATLVGNKLKEIESEKSLKIKQREIAFVNQQLAEAQLSALQTQMNPHFIFNSLNSIKKLILNNEQQNASRYLSKFAQLIRITLNQSREIFTTLHENVEYLESYLTMEKLRFDDSFTFRIMVDDHIDKEEVLIPTLMIQPLAENAIWHGLMCKDGEKRLLIKFSQENETIICTIRDNGIGINRSEELKQLNRSQHQSVGLVNLRNRIKIMNEKYDMGCTLEIRDLGGIYEHKCGTCVILKFNIITNKQSL